MMTITKMTIGVRHHVRKGCGGNRCSGGVSVTRLPQPFSLSETQKNSDAASGKGAVGQEAVVLQEVVQQLTTNQKTRGVWQKTC
jgi:hypothetical protein